MCWAGSSPLCVGGRAPRELDQGPGAGSPSGGAGGGLAERCPATSGCRARTVRIPLWVPSTSAASHASGSRCSESCTGIIGTRLSGRNRAMEWSMKARRYRPATRNPSRASADASFSPYCRRGAVLPRHRPSNIRPSRGRNIRCAVISGFDGRAPREFDQGSGAGSPPGGPGGNLRSAKSQFGLSRLRLSRWWLVSCLEWIHISSRR
jgi:hypothetical protein